MAHSGASSADAAAWADFASAAGLDVTISTPSPTTTAPGVEAALAAPPASGEPEAEEPPSSGGMLEGILAEPPALGEPALVETAPVDDDIAPPVLGVPSSSEDEEELIADPAGAPMVGAPPAAGGTADVGVQTSQNVIIPAFDMVDVAAQTDGKVAFSSFVGDMPQVALAAAIRALSPGSLFRLDGALRQALAQPLVDVAPSLQGGGSTSPVPPDLDLLGDTPGEQTASSGGIVDPGPGPASARIFWEEQNATVVAEQARPLPDDDFDAPATALEAYLKDQDSAAGQTASPSSSGQPPSSSQSPGGKAPFKKARPPALVLEEPEAKVGKAPPVPYPDKQIAFLEPPKRRPSSSPNRRRRQPRPLHRLRRLRRPLPGQLSPRLRTQRPSRRPAPTTPGRSTFDARRSSARSRWPDAQALESRIEREIEEQRQAEEAAALAKATEAGPPFGGLAAGSEVTPTPVTQGRTSMVGGAPEVTTPSPGSGTLPRSSPTRPSSRPASSTAPALPASSSTSTPGTSSTAGPSPGQSGIFPPPTSPFPPG